MSESRDPAIKLFGKTIPVPTSDEVSSGDADRNGMKDLDDETTKEEGRGGREEKDLSNNRTQIEEKDQATQNSEDPTEPATCSEMNETPETPSVDKETISTKATEGEEEQGDMSVMNEKTLKKPDKILPCPRCSSLDTKFCYYNNYNANQPRHFCKNCQRYWTAGGTMRNVPVGAGRRKNKNTSHYRQMTVSEALQTARTNISESIRHVPLKPNDTVLNFGLDTPLCESMASVLNLAENTMRNCQRNGCHRKEQRFPIPCVGGENGEEHSSGSSITSSNTMEGNRSNLQEPTLRNCQSYPQVPCFPGAPWSYPWNPAQWSSPLPPQPSVLQPPPPPPFCASSFPISFFPATPYWGCSVPGTWSLPWPSPLSSPLSSPNTGSSGSNSNSPTLGKHSREGNINDPENEDRANQGKSEQCLWIPKTLRIDDPEEAAKSSIWATLGIKNDKADTIKGGGLFKAFQSKTDEKNHTIETSQVLHANPAALSRSINFHESS